MDKDLLKHRITERRKALGITQAELANRSGLSPAAISQIESGARLPMLPVLQKIADTLAVSMDYLAGRSNSPDIAAPTETNDAQTFFRDFQTLSQNDQEFIRKSVEYLKEKKR